MNERIRRLMEQAVTSIDGQTFGKTYIPDAFTEKFAELIIIECVREFVRKQPVSVNVSNRARHVFKHFGVKE